jgi:DNA-directed RNA polymerase subunit M/transcription elongation factor TFIIS
MPPRATAPAPARAAAAAAARAATAARLAETRRAEADAEIAERVAAVRHKVRARYAAALWDDPDQPQGDDPDLPRKLEILTWNRNVQRAEKDLVPRFWTHPRFRTRYTSRALSLAFNIRRVPGMRERLLSGELSPKAFVDMTCYEMYPDLWTPVFERIATKQLRRMAPVPTAHETPYTCGKCRGKRIAMTQLQTRSADEPMTCFFFCQDCGKSWKQ